MNIKPLSFFSAAIAAAVVMAMSPASAGGGIIPIPGGVTGGGHCHNGGGGINIWKQINIYKPISIWKNIQIENNINIEKNIEINKSITINKNTNVAAEAFAFASASAGAGAGTVVYSGGGGGGETVVNRDEEMGAVEASQTCQMQEATIVKAIHAVCIAADHSEFPASHMMKDTWIDSSYEGEIARCIPGSRVKVVVGDVVQSDQGMAGQYEKGSVFMCGEGEALRHYKNGMIKCAPAVPVKDCTERTNLRKYGTGDFFFSYVGRVCATPAREAEASRGMELTGMSMQGGVGP